jgi:hypothetical protein
MAVAAHISHAIDLLEAEAQEGQTAHSNGNCDAPSSLQ